MSHKSRHRQKPELGPNVSNADVPDDARANVYRLTGKLQDMFEAIVSGFAIISQGPEPDDALWLEDFPEDEFDNEEFNEELWADESTAEDLAGGVLETVEAYGHISLTIRLLARELLARALEREPAQSVASFFTTESTAEVDSDAAIVDKLVDSLLPRSLPEPMRPSRQARREAFDEAAWLIREIGLEEYDVSCALDTSADGTPELFAESMSPESAHVALLEYLFARAEIVVDTSVPLLGVERDASAWEFSQWSVSPPPGRGSPQITEFAASVREQEYSLVDRQMVTLGTSVMEDFMENGGLAELYPRQNRMAEALLASFVDVFECVGLEGTRATFRSMRDGRTFDVHEHMRPAVYAPGWLAFGRLLPFDGELHLRSPGTLFIDPDDPIHFKAAVEAFAHAAATAPPAVALEALISADVFGISVPRSMKPARSKADARAMLDAIADILDEADMERAGADEAPGVLLPGVYYTPGAHADSGAAAGAGGIQFDATLERFMAALEEQAAGGGPERQQRARAKKKKKGKRRR